MLYETKDLGEFVKLNRKYIYAYIHNYGRIFGCWFGMEEAEDLFQEVCFTFARNNTLQKYDPKRKNSYKTYIQRCLLNALCMATHKPKEVRYKKGRTEISVHTAYDGKEFEDVDDDIDFFKYAKEKNLNIEILQYIIEGYPLSIIKVKVKIGPTKVVQDYKVIMAALKERYEQE